MQEADEVVQLTIVRIFEPATKVVENVALDFYYYKCDEAYFLVARY